MAFALKENHVDYQQCLQAWEMFVTRVGLLASVIIFTPEFEAQRGLTGCEPIYKTASRGL